jgi:transcriptional regulator with GAF, ATPase, and Fis domain
VTSTPDIGLHCAFTDTIKHINPDYLLKEEGQSFPEEGDILLRVGGYSIDKDGQKLWAQIRLLRRLFELRNEPLDPNVNPNVKEIDGERFVLAEFRSRDATDPDEVRQVWCRLGRSSPAELIPSILWFFLKIGLFAVGALVFWKRPDDRAAAQFFLMCILTLGAYMGGYHWLRISTQRELLLVFMICGVLLPPASLHFYLLFPRPKRFLEEHPYRTLAAIYGPPLLFLAAIIPTYLTVRAAAPRDGIPDLARFDRIWWFFQTEVATYLQLAGLWYLISVICLIHSFRSAGDVSERNQVKWIMMGSIVALVPIGYTLFLVIYAQDDFGSGAGTLPMFLASVCFTVAFTVSITRYRLMQLDQLLSSGAVYFLISSLAVLVYYAVVFIIIVVTDLVVGSRVFSGPSLMQTLGVGASFLVFLLLLDLARSRIKKALDRRFYKEKYQLDRTLSRMGKAIEQLVDPPTLARRLLQASAELLNVSWGAVYLRDGDPPLYRLVGSLGTSPPLAELSPGCPLVEALKMRGFLVVRSAAAAVVDPAQRQLRLIGGEVAHALAHEGQLLALLVLGPKNMGLYGSDDLNLLAAFAQLTALALESAERHRTIDALNRDLSEKVDKISEQQRRIFALQSQLTRQTTPNGVQDGVHLNGAVAPPASQESPAAVPGGIIGSSLVVRHLLELMRKVAATHSAVLIRGESGTGKELLARALHESSPRAAKGYVKVHCAALSPTLLESELFGHVKGAFTGAHKDKIGRFELANGSTLFLDEIGDISLEVQTKLLRVLQEKTFERVGSSEPVQVDVRIVAATHQNLEGLIRQGRFREDLYYRLKVIDISVPPLRDRREDIPELALYFLNIYATRFGRAVQHIDDDAMTILKSYRWPGNIRELENVMERALVVTEGPSITVDDLPEEIAQAVATERAVFVGVGVRAVEPFSVDQIRGERRERELRERERLVRALAAARGNKAEAARALGLARSTLVSRLKKFGLS